MSNRIAGAIDIDFLEALILPLAIGNAISEKLTLSLTLISRSEKLALTLPLKLL